VDNLWKKSLKNKGFFLIFPLFSIKISIDSKWLTMVLKWNKKEIDGKLWINMGITKEFCG